MALRIKDENSVPTERWQFPVSATNYTVEAPNYYALYPKIVAHCNANNVPPPTEQEVVNWACANLSIGCFDDQTREPLMNRWLQGLPSLVPQAGCCGSKK